MWLHSMQSNFLSKFILYIITISGGFTVPGVNIEFVNYPNIGNNLYLSFFGVFDLFSVSFFGKPVLNGKKQNRCNAK